MRDRGGSWLWEQPPPLELLALDEVGGQGRAGKIHGPVQNFKVGPAH